TLVIVDTAAWGHNMGYVERFARAGGRVLLQYHLLGQNSANTTPATFGVTVAQTFFSPPPVFNWNSSLFAGLSSPLLFQDIYNIDGEMLQPSSSARAAAGYLATPAANQAAVVIGNLNRTIVNSFILDTAVSAADATQFAQNEIDFLIGPAS